MSEARRRARKGTVEGTEREGEEEAAAAFVVRRRCRSSLEEENSTSSSSSSSSTTSLSLSKKKQLVWNLRRHALSLEKTLRHRVLRWCAKFEAEKESPALVWKKGRNQHARALLSGLRRGVLPAPFDAGPPQEPLGAGVPVACAVAVGLDSRGETKVAKSKRPLLDVVPGTAALRLAPPLLLRSERAEEEEEEAQPSSSSSAAAAFSQVQLPSRVELAASLGAATEKIAELEWRLGEKERRSKAREWESGVAAARASAALLRSFDFVEEEEAVERRARKPRARHVAAAASPLPALPPSPSPVKKQAAAAAKAPQPLQLRRPKVGPVAPTPPPPQKKKKQPEDLIPSVSLEELSRRISALAPQF